MGHVELMRPAVCRKGDSTHKIEPEKRKVGKVVPAQGLGLQVRVDQAKPFEAPGRGLVMAGIREHDALVVADHHHLNLSGAIDKKADLAADFK
jgi:hypothetical protein